MCPASATRSVILLAALASPVAAAPEDLPPGAVRRLGPVRHLGTRRLALAAFSADGRQFAGASGEETVHFWQSPTSVPSTLQLGDRDHGPCSLALSADSRRLAVGYLFGTVLYDTASAKIIRKWTNSPSAIAAVAVSADGNRLAAAFSRSPAVDFWDAGGDKVTRLEGRSGFVSCLGFAGDRLLVGTEDGAIEVWQCAPVKRLGAIKTGAPVRALAITVDGRLVFAEGDRFRILVLEVDAGRIVQTLEGHSSAMNALSCTPDGRALASAGTAGDVRIWDVGSGEELLRLNEGRPEPCAIALCPDGRSLLLALAGRSLEHWDLTGVECTSLMPGQPEEIDAIVFAEGGRCVQSWSGGQSALWKVQTSRMLGKGVGEPPNRESVLTSPGGKYRVTTNGESVFPLLVSTATGKEVPLDGSLRTIRAAAFSLDDKVLVGAGSDGNVTLWETGTGQILAELKAHDGRANCVAFSPDGKTFATGGGDASVLIWSLIKCGSEIPESWRDPKADDLEAMFKALTAEKGTEAFTAMRALTAVPKKSVPFLRGKLPEALDVARIKRFINQLDSEDFETREKASLELERLGRDAEQALRDTLDSKPSAEVRRRVTELLAGLKGDDSPRVRCWTRAVFVLEQVGTPEARAVLKLLAEGDRVAKAAEDARAALKRK